MLRLLGTFALVIAAPLAVAHEGHDHGATATASSDAVVAPSEADGWIPLFDGTSLDDWTACENPAAFTLREDGVLVVNGERGHLFYTGDVEGADFKNFELWVEVLTKPGSNSGVFFHTEVQDEGWPTKGYEVQVNQTQGDARKSGSLYAVADVMDQSPVNDDEWYTTHLTVRGKHIVVRLNGEVVTDYTEPDDLVPPADRLGRRLSSGTFAIQGHDPGSTVHYRSVWVKPLK